VLRHGMSLFRAFGDSGFPWYGGLVRLLTLTITQEPGFPVLGGLALVGMIVCLRRRQLLLVLWIAAVVLVQSRAASQKVVVPLALLAGIGLSDVLLPLLNGQQWPWRDATATLVQKPLARLATCVLGLLLVYVTFASMSGFREQLGALSTDDRATNTWVAQNLPPQSRVLVLSPAEWWGTDRSSEWFPVLTGMESVATVQGYEWLPGFSQRIERYNLVQHCFFVLPRAYRSRYRL